MKIGVIGCKGRMAKTIITQIINSKDYNLSAATLKPNDPLVGEDIGKIISSSPINIKSIDDNEKLFSISDAVIDFSNTKTSIESASLAVKYNKILVIGTTGFSDDEFKIIKQESSNTKIIWSSNMSIGVNLLFNLTRQISALLDDEFDIEIVEMHHNNKIDSPSGTAISLGKHAAMGRKVDFNQVSRKSREGIIGKRPKGEIGFSTIRGGDVIGDHTVIFAGDGERIEISHKASNRTIYAKGAIKAARWALDKPNGLYSMQDIFS